MRKRWRKLNTIYARYSKSKVLCRKRAPVSRDAKVRSRRILVPPFFSNIPRKTASAQREVPYILKSTNSIIDVGGVARGFGFPIAVDRFTTNLSGFLFICQKMSSFRTLFVRVSRWLTHVRSLLLYTCFITRSG